MSTSENMSARCTLGALGFKRLEWSETARNQPKWSPAGCRTSEKNFFPANLGLYKAFFRKRKVDKDFKGSALFGEWQVDHYQPPIARDGKVPRNAFGNVDLYQECMLPIGTVWIREIEHGTFSRVCRKLGIDTAKAVIGFDGKKGYPVTEGYILCTENEVNFTKFSYLKVKSTFCSGSENCLAVCEGIKPDFSCPRIYLIFLFRKQ